MFNFKNIICISGMLTLDQTCINWLEDQCFSPQQTGNLTDISMLFGGDDHTATLTLIQNMSETELRDVYCS